MSFTRKLAIACSHTSTILSYRMSKTQIHVVCKKWMNHCNFGTCYLWVLEVMTLILNLDRYVWGSHSAGKGPHRICCTGEVRQSYWHVVIKKQNVEKRKKFCLCLTIVPFKKTIFWTVKVITEVNVKNNQSCWNFLVHHMSSLIVIYVPVLAK